MELIDRQVVFLGWCLIDVHQFDGVVYEDFDIVPIKQNDESKYVERIPNCSRNMSYQDYYETKLEDFKPKKLIKIIDKVNVNGFLEEHLIIKDVQSNEILVSKKR